jgi:hypothetical protein
VYADLTLETVVLYAPDYMAIFITDAPAKRSRTICSLLKLEVSHFLIFHGDYHSTKKLCYNRSTTECKQMEEEHSVLPTEVLPMQPKQRNSLPQFLTVSIILSTSCCYAFYNW